MTLNSGPHLLEPCLGKPDFRVVILTAQFDPSIEHKPAQHHFPCPDWKAVGQPPVGQAEVLQDRSLAHIGACICGSHFLAFSPNSAIRSKLIACSRYSPSIFMALSRSNFFVAVRKKVQENRVSECVGLLFAAFRPAALAALALVHTHGQTARRVHHFSGQNELRTASASALFRCL